MQKLSQTVKKFLSFLVFLKAEEKMEDLRVPLSRYLAGSPFCGCPECRRKHRQTESAAVLEDVMSGYPIRHQTERCSTLYKR